MFRVQLLVGISLVCWNVGHSEAAAGTTSTNMSDFDVYGTIGIRCCPSDKCFPSQPDVAELNNMLTGRVILPHMYEFINQTHMYNTLEQRYPSIVVMVHSAEDIQKTILFARKFNLHVTIRSSGHDYVGRSTWDGSININLSEMRDYEVKLNSERSEHGEAKVQTGLTWADIYEKLDKEYNRTIVGGSAHTVTPGGYTLGGGHSPISRSLGYAVDNVLEIQAVLADGRIATCTEKETVIRDVDDTEKRYEDGDLFWAMRGGGGGTFGVVVYFVYKLHAMPAGMLRADAWFPMKVDTLGMDLTPKLLPALSNLIKYLPKEWGGYYLMTNSKNTYEGVEMTGSLQLAMNKFGPWDGSEENAFKEFNDIGRDLPIPIEVQFTNLSSFWDYEKDAYDPPIVRLYPFGTMLQAEKVNDDFQQFIRDEFFTNFKDIYLGCTGIMLGGRTTEFSVDSTPLNPGYRSAVSCLSCGVPLGNPEGNQPWFEQSKYDKVLIPLVDEVAERLRKFGTGMYNNEPWKNNPHWQDDFWGKDNYDRLLKIKLRYDPDNFFTCHHCVGSDLKRRSGGSGAPWTSGTDVNMVYIPLMMFVLLLQFI